MSTKVGKGTSLSRALQLTPWPFVLSCFVTLARFVTEWSELPSLVSFLLGIIWLTIIVAAYWGWKLAKRPTPYRVLFLAVLAFSLLSRIPVVLMWWITSTYGLGTHYDMYRDLAQALAFQFLVSAGVQTMTGFLVGSAVIAYRRGNRTQQSATAGEA